MPVEKLNVYLRKLELEYYTRLADPPLLSCQKHNIGKPLHEQVFCRTCVLKKRLKEKYARK